MPYPGFFPVVGGGFMGGLLAGDRIRVLHGDALSVVSVAQKQEITERRFSVVRDQINVDPAEFRAASAPRHACYNFCRCRVPQRQKLVPEPPVILIVPGVNVDLAHRPWQQPHTVPVLLDLIFFLPLGIADVHRKTRNPLDLFSRYQRLNRVPTKTPTTLKNGCNLWCLRTIEMIRRFWSRDTSRATIAGSATRHAPDATAPAA